MTANIYNAIDQFKLSLARKFNNATKIYSFKSFKSLSYSRWPESWKRISYKAYPRFQQVLLPNPTKPKIDLIATLFKRSSCRNFSKKPLSLQQFGDLLYYSAGLKRYITGDTSEKRFYPSAGARYPIEVYPFVFNVNQLKSAIYHYHIKTHSLELILNKPFYRATFKNFSQPWLKKSAVLLVMTAVFNRTENKYGDRGYRHILTEYGHIAQNIYLMSAANNLGCCSIGGFVDDGLNKLLDIDGIDESVIGVMAIGTKGNKYDY